MKIQADLFYALAGIFSATVMSSSTTCSSPPSSGTSSAGWFTFRDHQHWTRYPLTHLHKINVGFCCGFRVDLLTFCRSQTSAFTATWRRQTVSWTRAGSSRSLTLASRSFEVSSSCPTWNTSWQTTVATMRRCASTSYIGIGYACTIGCVDLDFKHEFAG